MSATNTPSIKIGAVTASLSVLVILSLVVVGSASREGGLCDIGDCGISVGVTDEDPVDLPAEKSEKPVLAVLHDGI